MVHRQTVPWRSRSNQQGRDADRDDGNQNSAGYVAIERVTGKLAGRRGSFILAQRTMTEAAELIITVVPDSGTGELTGLAGSMTIQIADGNTPTSLTTQSPQRLKCQWCCSKKVFLKRCCSERWLL